MMSYEDIYYPCTPIPSTFQSPAANTPIRALLTLTAPENDAAAGSCQLHSQEPGAMNESLRIFRFLILTFNQHYPLGLLLTTSCVPTLQQQRSFQSSESSSGEDLEGSSTKCHPPAKEQSGEL